MWDEKNTPQFYPKGLDGKIKKMGLTQPRVNDNGKPDNFPYE